MNLQRVLLLLLIFAVPARAQVSFDEATARLKARERARRAATQPADSEPGPEQGSATSQPVVAAGGNHVLEEKYDNGKIKSRYQLSVAGVKWGPYALYSEDGKIAERGAYKNAQLDGQRRVYYPTGKVQLLETYRSGSFDGPRQSFYPTGQVKLRETYRAGQLDGELQEFDQKGRLVRVARYRAGGAMDALDPAGVAFFDQTYVDGILVYPRSAAMILHELARITAMKVPTVAASAPIPPHDGAGTSPQDRDDAVRMLMRYRYLCGVPYEGLALDPVYCAHDEAATAILTAIGRLDHTPPNPGWPKDRYQYAFKGTSSSNLDEAGGGPARCTQSVVDYMNDSDTSNIDRLGHRRWCLNPSMGKVGFASSGHFSAMWSFDESRVQIPDFDFVAYPAPGPFPVSYFKASYAWSISLNNKKYTQPYEKIVKVTITPVEVEPNLNEIKPLGKPLELKYFHVNLQGFGMRNCIIFQPEGVVTDSGSAYLVQVSGLTTRQEKPAQIVYLVQFFKPSSPADADADADARSSPPFSQGTKVPSKRRD